MVQAFHLPKNTRATLPYTPSPAREISKLADELEEPATSDAPAEFIVSDFVMMDIDSDTEEPAGLQPERAQPHGHHYIPKTMQEMAEEHAEARRQQLGSDADDLDEANDGEDEMMASPQNPLAARPTTGKSKKLPSKASLSASTSNNLSSSRSTKAKSNRESSATSISKRKRKNSRKKVEEESDSADLSLTDEEDQEDSEDQQVSPSKRARVRVAAKAKTTPVAITPSTRTLRPRISKRTVQIQEEEQDESD